MKQYIVGMFALAFVFTLTANVNSASATSISYPAGCNGVAPYSSTTGELCSAPKVSSECASGALYSSTTGELCKSKWQSLVTVLSPNGNEMWAKGTTQTIYWQGNTAAQYDVSLMSQYPCTTSGPCQNTTYEIASNVYSSSVNFQGSYGWLVGKAQESKNIPNGHYIIRVCQAGTNICDSSDNYFTIANGTTNTDLSITTPSRLPEATVGQPYSVKLEASGGTGFYGWDMGMTSFPIGGLGLTLGNTNCSEVNSSSCNKGKSNYIAGTPGQGGEGTYSFVLTLTSGSQTLTKTFTLIVNPATGDVFSPRITDISPSSGAVGTEVAIHGSGLSGATVNFGGHDVSSERNRSDSQITFTVPSSFGNCNSLRCTAMISLVNPGNYDVYVTNSGRQSNTANFRVVYGTTTTTEPRPVYVLPKEDPIILPSPIYLPGCSSWKGYSTTTGELCTNASTISTGRVLGATAFEFTQKLQVGSSGDEVVQLQNFLHDAGYDTGTANGVFGADVKAALVKFQNANGLVGDGIVGPRTRTILNK